MIWLPENVRLAVYVVGLKDRSFGLSFYNVGCLIEKVISFVQILWSDVEIKNLTLKLWDQIFNFFDWQLLMMESLNFLKDWQFELWNVEFKFWHWRLRSKILFFYLVVINFKWNTWNFDTSKLQFPKGKKSKIIQKVRFILILIKIN